MFSNIARLVAGMDDAKRVVGSAMSNIEKSVAQAKAALGALGVGLSAGYFVSLIRGSIDASDHLKDLSKSTDIAVEDLAGLRLLAKQTGTDLDGLAKGINRMSVEMGKDPEKFKALGITAKNNKGAFKQFADIFNLLPDIQQRNALSQAVFAKSWAEMAPALSEGGKRIGEIIERGAKLSGVTKAMTDQADEFNDKLAELTSTGGILTRMIGPLLPLLNTLADDMLKAGDKAQGLNDKISPLLEIMKVLVVLGSDVSFVFTTMGMDIARAIENVKLIVKGDFAGSKALGEMFKRDAEERRKALDEWQKRIMGLGTNPSSGASSAPPPGVDPAAAADAARRAAAFLKEKKDAAEVEGPFQKMMNALLEEELKLKGELTTVDKLALDIGKMGLKEFEKLTIAQQADLEAKAHDIDLSKQQIAESARAAEAASAYAAEYERRNVLVRDFNQTQSEALKNIEFETKLLGIEAPLASAGLLAKADEIKLTSQVNLQRDTAIGLRKIELDLERAMVALGPKTGADYEYRAQTLRDLADAQRAALPDVLAAKEAAKLSNDLTRNAVSEWQSLWSTVENTGRDVFVHVFSDGKSAFEGIGKAIKASVIDLLYQLTAKKWFVSIQASVAGALGIPGTGNAAGGSGGGFDLNSISSIGSLGSTIATGFSSASAVSGAMLGNLFNGSSLAFSVGEALPFVGAALAAYSIGKAIFGSNKQPAVFTGGLLQGSASQAGFSGTYLGTSRGDHDSQWEYPFYAMAAKERGLDALITDTFTTMRKLAEPLGLGGADLSGVSAAINLSGVGESPEAVIKAFADNIGTLTDSISEKLMPNLRDFVQGNETLTQTFARLAAQAEAEKQARRALDIQVLDLEGRAVEALAMKREDELAALSPTLRATQGLVYALQDQAIAADDVAKAQDVLRQAYNTQAATLTDTISKWAAVAKTLRDYGNSLAGVGSALTYSSAAAQFRAVAARAGMGDIDAMGQLQSVSEAFRTASLANSGSSTDYARDVARIRSAVGASVDVADRQGSMAQQQLDAATAAVSELISLREEVVSLKDAVASLQKTSAAAERSSDKVATILEGAANGSITLSTEAEA